MKRIMMSAVFVLAAMSFSLEVNAQDVKTKGKVQKVENCCKSNAEKGCKKADKKNCDNAGACAKSCEDAKKTCDKAAKKCNKAGQNCAKKGKNCDKAKKNCDKAKTQSCCKEKLLANIQNCPEKAEITELKIVSEAELKAQQVDVTTAATLQEPAQMHCKDKADACKKVTGKGDCKKADGEKKNCGKCKK